VCKFYLVTDYSDLTVHLKTDFSVMTENTTLRLFINVWDYLYMSRASGQKHSMFLKSPIATNY